MAGVSWYQSAQLFKGNRVTMGLDYQHIYGRAWYTNRETGETVTIQRRLMQSAHSHENEVAGYVDFRQDIAEWLTIDAGLRYDHHSTAGGEWVPQAGISIRTIETGTLKASVGKGFRNPNTRGMPSGQTETDGCYYLASPKLLTLDRMSKLFCFRLIAIFLGKIVRSFTENV